VVCRPRFVLRALCGPRFIGAGAELSTSVELSTEAVGMIGAPAGMVARLLVMTRRTAVNWAAIAELATDGVLPGRVEC
jgi:hypothetical protein